MKLIKGFKLAAVTACMSISGHALAGDAIEQAVKDKSRAQVNIARDDARKPAQVLSFLGVEKGMKVVELAASRGYYTELLAKVVGKEGFVYAQGIKDEYLAKLKAPQVAKIKSIKGPMGYADGEADVVLTFLNYHDIYNGEAKGKFDRQSILKEVARVLKPGGVLGIVDHSATVNSGTKDTQTLHRIDIDVVKADAIKAGFVLDSQSYVLKNNKDDRTLKVHNDKIKGATDRFVLKFTKKL